MSLHLSNLPLLQSDLFRDGYGMGYHSIQKPKTSLRKVAWQV